MFEAILTFDLHEIEPRSIIYRGPIIGEMVEQSAGQPIVLQGRAGLVPGYISGESFVTRADLACEGLTKAEDRAESFTREMCL